MLYGVRGLFGASEHVTAAEFHASHLARAVEERYPGVQVVGYADLLAAARPRARIAEIRREIRASGLAYPPLRDPSRAQPPARIAPITYLEPQAGNEAAFGLDFLASRAAGPRSSARSPRGARRRPRPCGSSRSPAAGPASS